MTQSVDALNVYVKLLRGSEEDHRCFPLLQLESLDSTKYVVLKIDRAPEKQDCLYF